VHLRLSNSAGGIAAKDALGNDVTVDGWLATHLPGDRSLVQVSLCAMVPVHGSMVSVLLSSSVLHAYNKDSFVHA
jgi:hypothetical protein